MLGIFAVLLAIEGGEWLIFIAAIVGAGGIGSLMTGAAAIRKLKVDEKSVEVTARTVAVEETEKAVQALGAVIAGLREDAAEKDREIEAVRVQLVGCERRWTDHVKMCPLFGTAGMGGS